MTPLLFAAGVVGAVHALAERSPDEDWLTTVLFVLAGAAVYVGVLFVLLAALA